MISVLLADDHDLVRAGIRSLLEECSDIRIVAEASNGKEAVSLYAKIAPDVVVLDISMPVMDGLEACSRIKATSPDARILVLTAYSEQQYAVRVLMSGALGYATKKISKKELQKAVHAVAAGKIFVPEESKDEIMMNLLNLKGRTDSLDTVSDREMQVLRLLAQGKRIKDIAAELNLSIKTIDNYRARILSKLNLQRTADLILFAHQRNLI